MNEKPYGLDNLRLPNTQPNDIYLSFIRPSTAIKETYFSGKCPSYQNHNCKWDTFFRYTCSLILQQTLVLLCKWWWTCPSPALFDSLIEHIFWTPKTLILAERTNLTNSETRKDRTDKGTRQWWVSGVVLNVVFVWCMEMNVSWFVLRCWMQPPYPNWGL